MAVKVPFTVWADDETVYVPKSNVPELPIQILPGSISTWTRVVVLHEVAPVAKHHVPAYAADQSKHAHHKTASDSSFFIN